MASNRTSGNLLGLQINGQFIACEMSCDFSFEAEMLGASPQIEGRWKEYIQGVRSWSISVNAGLLMRMVGAGLPDVLNAFMTGSTIAIAFRTKLNEYLPNLVISGNVFVQSGGISASVNTLATWVATLQGNGPFSLGINTNIIYGIGTGIDYEALQDGQQNIIGGDSGGISSVSYNSIPVSGNNGNGDNTTNPVASKIKNANLISNLTELEIGTYTTDQFDNTPVKPDDLVSIVYED